MALPSVSNTFTGGTSAIAAQVNQNFTDLVNAMTDGTKSFSIDALTLATNLIVGGTVSMTGQFLIKNGAVGSPGLTSSGFLTSGIYFAAGPTFGVTIAGTSILEIGSGSSTFRNNLNIFAGGGGAIATITGYNSSNTASSGVVFDAVLAGTAATGNAIFRSTVTGSSGRQWSWGGDQGNSGRFSIAQNSNLGSNDFLTISTAGALTFGATSGTAQHTMNGARLTLGASVAGGNIFLITQNTDNTSSASQSIHYVTVGGTSAGQAFTLWGDALDANSFVAGIRMLDNRSFRIERGNVMGSAGGPAFRIDQTSQAIQLGVVGGLGTAAGAYHSLNGTIVGQLGASFATVLAASGNTILDANIYRDGAGTEKAIRTVTGYSHLELSRETASSSNVLRLRVNYQDAQTADSTIVATNEITPFTVSAAGKVTLGSGTATQHTLNTLLATNGVQAATIANLPAAATAGNATGWIKITINGTTAYMPFWN